MNNPQRILRWGTVTVLFVCSCLIVLTIWGYGHVSLELPSGTAAQINGHTIVVGTRSLKLRPGTYHIATDAPRYVSRYDSFRVSVFRTVTYKPKLIERTSASIAYAATGVFSNSDLPPVGEAQWLGDTWVVETVGFSTPSVLAAHYQNGRWSQAYITGGTSDVTSLPTTVGTAVHNLEESLYAEIN